MRFDVLSKKWKESAALPIWKLSVRLFIIQLLFCSLAQAQQSPSGDDTKLRTDIVGVWSAILDGKCGERYWVFSENRDLMQIDIHSAPALRHGYYAINNGTLSWFISDNVREAKSEGLLRFENGAFNLAGLVALRFAKCPNLPSDDNLRTSLLGTWTIADLPDCKAASTFSGDGIITTIDRGRGDKMTGLYGVSGGVLWLTSPSNLMTWNGITFDNGDLLLTPAVSSTLNGSSQKIGPVRLKRCGSP